MRNLFLKRRRVSRGIKGFLLRTGRVLRWAIRLFMLLLIVDLFYLGLTWPDWKKLATGPVPKSAFMVEYEKQQADNKEWPRLRWQPVSLSVVPKYLIRAVILAEDSRFYEHSGFDLIAFKEAMDHNLNKGRFVLGASTISQQTVKNLFLSPSRDPLRKWHELMLTWGMERNLTKRRILEIYLNVAQFGQGIYGVRAASQAYWGIPPEQLSVVQAAELAATLPGPVKNNPASRTRYFEKRTKKLVSLFERYPGDAAYVVRERPIELIAPPPENGNPENEIEVSEPAPLTEQVEPEPVPPPLEADQVPPPEEDAGKVPVEEHSIRANPL